MQPTQHVITDSSGEYTRKLWFLPGPAEKTHRLCLFLDAEHYLRDMNCLPVHTELMESGAIPPMTCLFISHESSEDRQRDYLCHDRYSRFIAEEVVAWAQARANIQTQANVICGLSLSGLAGAYIALQYPEKFEYALCQSSSFWWLATNEMALSATNARFWLSVGDQETDTEVAHTPELYQKISQIAGVELAAERFKAFGATVNYQQYAGGHAIAPWREELSPALIWLLGDG